VRCDETASVNIVAVATVAAKKHAHGKPTLIALGRLVLNVAAGAQRTLALHLAPPALAALTQGRHETLTLTLTATNANGTGHASTAAVLHSV
jgi:hypothetical protein